jgi:hypothetical protein
MGGQCGSTTGETKLCASENFQPEQDKAGTNEVKRINMYDREDALNTEQRSRCFIAQL